MESTSPDARLDLARNRFGHARQQITRLPDNPSTRAAVDLIDQGLHELTLVPKFPPSIPGEASLFFEGATLEQAVHMVLRAALHPSDDLEESVVEAVTSKMAAFFSDADLAALSGQVSVVSPPPVSQAGLPTVAQRVFGKRRPA